MEYTIDTTEDLAEGELDQIYMKQDHALTVMICLRGPAIDWWLERLRERWTVTHFEYDGHVLRVECERLARPVSVRIKRMDQFLTRIAR